MLPDCANKRSAAHGEVEVGLLQYVPDAIGDLVEVVKTFKCNNKLSQIITSSLFEQQQKEAEAVIDRAMFDLQVLSVIVFLKHGSYPRCQIQSFVLLELPYLTYSLFRRRNGSLRVDATC